MDFVPLKPGCSSIGRYHPSACLHDTDAPSTSDHAKSASELPALAVHIYDDPEFGMDPYSYAPAHLRHFQPPADLTPRLPERLQSVLTEWQYAGAAVHTALDRIALLAKDSLYRGYPQPDEGAMRRRKSSAASSRPRTDSLNEFQSAGTPLKQSDSTDVLRTRPSISRVDENTSPLSFPKVSTKTPIQPDPRSGIRSAVAALSPLSLGIDSPPATPDDSPIDENVSWPANCPESQPNRAAAMANQEVYQQLRSTTMPPLTPADSSEAILLRRDSSHMTDSQSISVASFMSGSSVPNLKPGPSFCQSSWEVYLNTYTAELRELHGVAFPRLRGCERIVDRIRYECHPVSQNAEHSERNDPIHTLINQATGEDDNMVCSKEALAEFETWWQVKKSEAEILQAKVEDCRLPLLQNVLHERQLRGLPI